MTLLYDGALCEEAYTAVVNFSFWLIESSMYAWTQKDALAASWNPFESFEKEKGLEDIVCQV